MSSVTPQQEPMSKNGKRWRLIITAMIFYCTFALGVCNNMLGPSIIDFSNKFETDVDTVSVVFSIFTGAYLVGAFSYGFFAKFVPRMVLVVFFLTLMSGGMFIIPYLSSMTIFFVLNTIVGIGAGGYDCCQVAWIIEIWRGEASPLILGQHFMYSFGTIMPSLILAPFLNGEEKEEFTTTTPQTSLEPSSSTTPPAEFISELGIPFMVAGIVGVAGLVMQIFLSFKSKSTSNPSPNDDDEINNGNNNVNEKKVDEKDENIPINLTNGRGYTILLIVLSCCILGVYQGMEITNLQFIPTFAVYSEVGLTEKEAARVLSGLTIAFSAMRFVGIIVVLRVQPHFIIVGNFALIITGNLIILFAGGSNPTWLWVGCICLGMGFSTTYPAYYAYIEKYLYITDTTAAIITVSGGLMGFIYPFVIGSKIKESPKILIYVNFFSIALFIGSFVVVFWLTKIRKTKKNKSSDD